ncbi:helix-turn-helix domain-containing protein [Streptomyces sp. NPDC004111]|uniref:helix-turn-helix domain-containing protein n=1 Tax=Streptomyces sp. NPDC004111 TaxID=3364690 RepID=UPI00367B4A8D
MSDVPVDGPPPERFTFATTDPDEAQDFIAAMYRAGRPPRARTGSLTAPVSISQISAGGLSYVDFTMPPDVTLHLTAAEVRLARAHRDLLRAEPAARTVTDIAYRWGFHHPGRFAADYRRTYGEPPSHTLRRW